MSSATRSRAAVFRVTTMLALILVFLATLLIALRIQQLMLEFTEGRAARAAQQISEQAALGFNMGLGLRDQTRLPQALERQAAQDTALVSGWVQADNGDILADLRRDGQAPQTKPIWSAQLQGVGAYAGAPVDRLFRRADQRLFVGTSLADSTGHRVGVLWLLYDLGDLRDAGWSAWKALQPYALALGISLALALGLLAMAWSRLVHRRLEQVRAKLDRANTPQPDDLKALHDAPGGIREAVLIGVAVAVTALALGTLAWQGRQVARPLLLEQVDRNARSVLSLAEHQIERALALGVPADKLVGVGSMLKSELKSAPEIAFTTWQASANASPTVVVQADAPASLEEVARASSWNTHNPQVYQGTLESASVENGGNAGRLNAGTSLQYIDERMLSVLLDMAFAALVGLVLAREALGTTWQRSPLKPYLDFTAVWPMWRRQAKSLWEQARSTTEGVQSRLADWWEEVRGGAHRLFDQANARLRGESPTPQALAQTRIRLIVFLTAMSDELLRPFFTVFASEVQPIAIPLSPTALAALPVAAFMATLTLAQPLGPVITRHLPFRTVMAASGLVGGLLLLATAYVSNVGMLMALRAGSGMIFGLQLIVAQTAIIQLTRTDNRARGLVEVVAAIVAAGVCGPVLGGLLVDRLGVATVFAICGACLLLASVVSLRLPVLSGESATRASGPNWQSMMAILHNRQIMVVTWCVAMPARLAAVALLVVVTPLYLSSQGESATVTGRVLLGYFLVFMVTAPAVARWSDLSGRRSPWVIWGCALSAVACGLMIVVGGPWGATLCCGLLGLGQAFQSAPQLALVTEVVTAEQTEGRLQGATPTQALAAFRFLERFGSILAPLVIAPVVGTFGMTGAIVGVGLVLAIGTVGALVGLRHRPHSGILHGVA